MPKQHAASRARAKQAETSAHPSRQSERDDPRLGAAQKRLRESVGQADTLEAIREIVTNLLGCEEIGLFTVNEGKSGLLWSFGIDTDRHGTLESFDEASLRRVLRGDLHLEELADEKCDEHPALRAFVPIRRNGRTVAVLVMLKLLPQKLGFDDADIDLVNLLSVEAGRALFEGTANAHV